MHKGENIADAHFVAQRMTQHNANHWIYLVGRLPTSPAKVNNTMAKGQRIDVNNETTAQRLNRHNMRCTAKHRVVIHDAHVTALQL